MTSQNKRASMVGSAERRAALALVSPVNRRIQRWQQRAIHLRAIGDSAREPRPSRFLDEVEELVSEVTLHLGRLESTLETTPALDTSRVRDTLKALERLRANLTQAREALCAR